MTDPTNPTPQYAELCERLRATKTQVRMRPLFGGAIALPDGEETREVPINPDGPEAATALQSLHAENERMRLALEPFAFVAKNIPEHMGDGRYVEATVGLTPGELDKLPKMGGKAVQSAKLNIALDGLQVEDFRRAAAALSPDNAGGGNG